MQKNLHLGDELYKEIKKYAHKNNINYSEAIRELIEKGLCKESDAKIVLRTMPIDKEGDK